MSEYKDEIYLLIILFLMILASLAPSINAEINSKEECIKEGSITMCREVYTRVTTDWHINGEYKLKEDANERTEIFYCTVRWPIHPCV